MPSGTPAPGFRDSGYRTAENGAGKLYYVGGLGFGWSSTVPGESTDALFLGFDSGDIRFYDLNNRAFGFQLRCLQEEGVARHSNRTHRVSCWPSGRESLTEKNSPRVPSGTPAPGFRTYDLGKIGGVGSVGYSLASTEAGPSARFLYFYPGEIRPQNSSSRATGFQLRCLQE